MMNDDGDDDGCFDVLKRGLEAYCTSSLQMALRKYPLAISANKSK